MRDDFGILIITHQRPHDQSTLKMLERKGYTGKWWLVIDDEDPTADEYHKLYGDRVLVFSKTEIGKSFDEGDNFHDHRAGVYARNACWEFARQFGLKYYIQIDDDIRSFQYRRFGTKDGVYRYASWRALRLDLVFAAMVRFMENTPTLGLSVSIGGDRIGGVHNVNFGQGKILLKRKPMGMWLVATDRQFSFIGRMNDDVNTYMTLGNRGGLFFSYSGFQIDGAPTQQTEGGMHDIYAAAGTYQKAFYTIMMGPSYSTIRKMGRFDFRHHHAIKWNNALPKIVSEELRRT